jgi:hypothetical protein
MYGGVLPKILAEQERFDILFEFGDFDWSKLKDIGVMDISGRAWLVGEQQTKVFVEEVKRSYGDNQTA